MKNRSLKTTERVKNSVMWHNHLAVKSNAVWPRG